MKNILYVFLFVFMFGVLESTLFCQDQCSCAGKFKTTGPSFKVHGRLSNKNGNPTEIIWIIGTKRILGIRDNTKLPDNLSRLLGDFDTMVYGDFTVCPLTKSRPGVMQIICVQAAENLIAKKRS
jgi:hypothetical protein